MFDVIDRLMFRPFRYLRDPASVNRVYLRDAPAHASRARRSLRALSRSREWDDVLLARPRRSPSHGRRRNRRGIARTADRGGERAFFDFFNARPVLGRFFVAAEDTTPRGAQVAVLGYAYWKSEFGGRDVLGESLQVDNVLCTIIGVAPEGFVGVADGEPPAVFIPITTFASDINRVTRRVEYWRRYTMGLRRDDGATKARRFRRAGERRPHARVHQKPRRGALDPSVDAAEQIATASRSPARSRSPLDRTPDSRRGRCSG